MLQCSQGLARISTPRDAARPKGRHLVGPLSAAETRPDVRVPPLGAIFGFSAPNVARGVLKAPRPIAVAGAIDFAPPSSCSSSSWPLLAEWHAWKECDPEIGVCHDEAYMSSTADSHA